MNPNKLTTVDLKDILRKNNLATTGSKAELVSRIMEADPNGLWIAEHAEQLAAVQSASGATGTSEDDHASIMSHADPYILREMESLRKEKELMERELRLARRENNMLMKERELGVPPQNINAGLQLSRSNVNIRALSELISDFDGGENSYQNWERQVRLIKTTYEIDDNTMKILVGMKLKKKAIDWFHSRAEYLEISFEELLREMKATFDHRSTKLTLRKQFEARIWHHSEPFGDYYHDKVIMASRVPVDEDELVDYIIDGIPDEQLRNQARMQRFSSKTILLSAFEKISLSAHVSNRSFKDITKKIEGKFTKLSARSEDKSQRDSIQCYNCRGRGHYSKDCRKPRREKGTCFRCGEPGHRIQDCRSQNQPKTKDMEQVGNIYEDFASKDMHMQTVSYGIGNVNEKCTFQLNTLLDTGSPVSFIKERFIPYDLMDDKENSNVNFYGIHNTKLIILGTITANITIDNVVKDKMRLFVVPNNTMRNSVILGRDTLEAFHYRLARKDESSVSNDILEVLNIDISAERDKVTDSLVINEEISIEKQLTLKELFISEYVQPERPEYPKVNTKLDLVLNKHTPFHFNPRRLSYDEKNHLKVIINRLLDNNVIQPSDSEYASPIVLVRKRNKEYRMCVDYRHLNKYLQRDNYPLPLIEDQIDVLSGKKYFSLMDLKDGFHHIGIKEDCVKYTSFVTPLGQFEYKKMPFGLKTAPSKFQRFINTVFSELINTGDVVVYIDDILIASETLQHHMTILKRVFQLLVANKLELRLDKCKFLYTEIEYLGYVITKNGVKPGNRGINAIVNFPVPTDVRKVQGFLGLCSYFRKFVENFAILAKPLYDLVKKGKEFKFEDAELKAFEELKLRLTTTPVLAIYSPNDDTELHCDASSHGFGAILLQRKADHKLHPVFYFSKRTTPTESHYHSFELETLAIIYALKRFRIYLQGVKFKIVTDCNSLTLTLAKKEINPRIARWALELQSYDYVVEHRAGTRMKHADALSRADSVLVLEDNPFELNLSLCQNQDKKIEALRSDLEKQESSLFEMRNGLVYRKKNNNLLFYVPESMEKSVMYKYHDEMGHMGVDKTSTVIKQNYWFPKLTDKVESHIKNCLKCISFSPPSGKVEGYLNNIPKGNIPFETVHIDHCGPVDKQCLTKRHILVVVDGFTKFVKLYATKSTDSKESIKHLEQYFRAYSRPKTIISDRGTCFTSNEFCNFMEEMNIKHIKVATCSPQANGQVERVNRVLTPLLAKLSDKDAGKHWYQLLEEAEYAINNSVNKSTGEKPSILLFGVGQRGKNIDKLKEYLESNVTAHSRNLKSCRESAQRKTEQSQEYSKRHFDKKRKDCHKYSVGDYVMLKNFENTPGVSKKLIPRYKGPYKITKELRNNRYVVCDIEGFQISQKPYQGVWEPCNMRPWRKTDSGG